MNKLKINLSELWQPLALAGVVLIAAALRLSNLQALGYVNHYYTAAMVSMLKSWHNFFFVAAEPGGSITVDKPPVGLWIQAISIFIFGLNTFGLLFPEILAGLGSVILLFFLVKRYFGPIAGLLSALALAVTPVVVAVDRNNTMDSLLIFCLLLSAWAFIRAIETGKDRFLLLAAILTGIAFNIKMLEAFLPLPAFYALYFFGSKHRIWRKIGRLALATLVILVVSLSWVTIVQLTPVDQRPYVGSSGDNSEFSLIFGYNGLQRLQGMGQTFFGRNNSFPSSGMGSGGGNRQFVPNATQNTPSSFGFGGGNRQSTPGSPSSTQSPASGFGFGRANNQATPGTPVATQIPSSSTAFTGSNRQSTPSSLDSTASPSSNSPFTGRRSGLAQLGGSASSTSASNDIGQPGWLRLIQDPLFKDAGWLMAFSLFGLVWIGLRQKLHWPLSPRHQAVILWGLWFLATAVFFNIANFFHEYYLAFMAPPLAALFGMTIAELWELHQHKPWSASALLISFSGITLWLQIKQMSGYLHTTLPWKFGLIGLLVLGGVALILASLRLIHRKGLLAGFGLVVLAVMISPVAWSVLTMLNPSANQSLPAAYAGRSEEPENSGGVQINSELLSYLEARTQGITYLLAVPSSMQGSDYVIATGRPVLYIGGFMGIDEILSSGQLAQMVANHQIRYIYWDTENIGFGTAGNSSSYSDLTGWITGNCSKVSGFDTRTQNSGAPDGTSSNGLSQSGYMIISLYDCGKSS